MDTSMPVGSEYIAFIYNTAGVDRHRLVARGELNSYVSSTSLDWHASGTMYRRIVRRAHQTP